MKCTISYLLVIFGCLIQSSLFSQRSNFFIDADTINKPRTLAVSSGMTAAWAGSTVLLWNIWYKDGDIVKWHTFDDSREWLQMDKAGHVYTAYQINHLTSGLLKWSGVSNVKSTLLGTGIAAGYQTTVEIFDGKSDTWGFSWSDFGSNLLGASLFASQQLKWGEQKFIPKFSTHLTEFAKFRPHVLGSTTPERLLKDYNGQSYWISFAPGNFIDKHWLPKWACVSLGYSINNKLYGDSDYYTFSNGDVIKASRQFLFSFDIDFSKLPIKKPWLKKIVNQFNYLKVPFPTVIIADQKLQFNPLYF